MKALTVTDSLYFALEEAANRSGRPVSDLLSDAIEAWLINDAMDDAERREIGAARAEAAEQGGIAFEALFAADRGTQ
ncbi:MAG: hypothetical protein OXF79_09860 [Chloroflexi bacterium]|nr:hypothetical protein [Chloroflexota bacterium]